MPQEKRISILLTLAVIGGLAWYMKFGSVPTEQQDLPRTVTEQVSAPVALPLPDEFEFFTVPSEKTVRRTFSCEDAFYVVLVFPRGADYRTDPRSAVYNSATPCTKGEPVEVSIDAAKFNVAPGDYYLLVADQGTSGSWYNPRQ